MAGNKEVFEAWFNETFAVDPRINTDTVRSVAWLAYQNGYNRKWREIVEAEEEKNKPDFECFTGLNFFLLKPLKDNAKQWATAKLDADRKNWEGVYLFHHSEQDKFYNIIADIRLAKMNVISVEKPA